MAEGHVYDVFLSYHHADQAAVEFIAQKLRGEGLNPFFAPWHLVAGEPWQEALEKGLDDSSTCAVFLGPQGTGSWENEEMRSALDTRTRNRSFRVIPVLLPGASMPQQGPLPRFLARLTWVDFRKGLEDEQAFHQLVSGIQGIAPGPDLTPNSSETTNAPLPAKRKPDRSKGRLNKLFAHPVFWLLCGALPVLLLTALFSSSFRCMLEYRLTEATVALIVLLAAGAAGAFRLAPEGARARLQLFYAGFSIVLLIIVLIIKFQPPPNQETCFPTSISRATPGSIIPQTDTPAPTLDTPSAAPFTDTPTPVCAAPHPIIQGISIPGAITMVKPAWKDECVWVDKQQEVVVRWENVPEDAYTLWVLVYSPLNQKYYPRPCGLERLPTSGERACQARFEKPEPYEIIFLLADQQATEVLRELSAGASQGNLPGGIAEKAAQRVARR